jgi:hypothetical protein
MRDLHKGLIYLQRFTVNKAVPAGEVFASSMGSALCLFIPKRGIKKWGVAFDPVVQLLLFS